MICLGNNYPKLNRKRITLFLKMHNQLGNWKQLPWIGETKKKKKKKKKKNKDSRKAKRQEEVNKKIS